MELEDLPIVQADPLQMHQLFDNLTANALKFSRPGVPPFIKISSSFNSGHSLEITVEDNGIGFDRSAAGQLFKPFHRLVGHSEYEGSGMGLAICRQIAERHGGTISAEGNPGKGSKFTVTLPYTPKG